MRYRAERINPLSPVGSRPYDKTHDTLSDACSGLRACLLTSVSWTDTSSTYAPTVKWVMEMVDLLGTCRDAMCGENDPRAVPVYATLQQMLSTEGWESLGPGEVIRIRAVP